MKDTSNSLNELKQWLDSTNNQLQAGSMLYHIKAQTLHVGALIKTVSETVKQEYPFYSEELPKIGMILFQQANHMGYVLNPYAFGELFIIIKHIFQEPSSGRFWDSIHPRIIRVSKALYFDKYYDSAAEKAIREVETVLRELFSEMKPNSAEPKNVCDVMNALLSDPALYDFDTSTVSGKDYHKGIKQLFEACFSTYRNPSSHRNIVISQRESFEQITLASQLIYILEQKRLCK